jgi:hypothetical protein
MICHGLVNVLIFTSPIHWGYNPQRILEGEAQDSPKRHIYQALQLYSGIISMMFHIVPWYYGIILFIIPCYCKYPQ